MRQVMVRGQTVVQRCEDRADGAGVNATVGVSADCPINGASVQAGAAANAEQTLPQRTAENLGAPVIQQNEVELFGTIDLIRLASSGNHRRIYGELLPGCRASQHFEEVGQIG